MKTIAPQTLLRGVAPADLGPGPRTGVTPLSDLNRSLEESFARTHLTGNRANLIRASVRL